VAGYLLFLVEAGAPVSREVAYRTAGDRAVICGFSRYSLRACAAGEWLEPGLSLVC
jgi:hypothetical protein